MNKDTEVIFSILKIGTYFIKYRDGKEVILNYFAISGFSVTSIMATGIIGSNIINSSATSPKVNII